MVRTRPGTNSPLDSYHPYGYTDTYYFNGIDPSDFEEPMPIGSSTNAQYSARLLVGKPYLTKIYDEK